MSPSGDELNGVQKQALDEIKRWLTEDKSNLHARMEDKYLLSFLRGNDFDLEETKTKIENYYTMRREEAIWFRNRDPCLDEIQELVKLGVFIPLKSLYKNHLVVIVRTAAHNPKKHTQENVFKAGQMLLDIAALLEFDGCRIDGIIAIFDMKDVTVWHAKPLTPNVVKRTVFSWANYHYNPDHFEFVSAPSYVNVVLNLFKSFMPEKMKKMVRVHKNWDTFYDVVDKSCLPSDYGGSSDSLSVLINYWNEKLLLHRDWLLDDEQYRAD